MLNRILCDVAPKAVGSYSIGTIIDNTIFLSGQLPINPQSGKIESTTIEEQTKQSLNTIKAILESNQSSMNQIVKTTVFLDSITDFAAFDSVYQTYFKKSFPARSAFEVGKLPMGAKIEIEVIAITNSKVGE